MTCEKCWRDSAMYRLRGVGVSYRDLVDERRGAAACTPEEQAGSDATVCEHCGRGAVHQHVRICVACGWQAPLVQSEALK
jgi:hypothetical protein